MDTNKMREQFEAAFVEEMCRRGGEGFRPTVLYSLSQKKPDGDFQHITESLAWWAWQASREAVAVDLPSACAYEGLTEHLGSVIELSYEAPEHDPIGLSRLSDVRAAIEAHGLKVAP
ncbi:hypothetical protein PAGU2196_11400 [Pseudomonas sp. PAGU 2196]|uniref:hypothetical protein n=1 Tax=Pseudomonas sp. PAGU 2196 TaxID=2793997 RepID=UPI001EDE270B|nr:hypothetical protein [Pseudomonas sp. PAGU 2196]GHS80306.1 hypothetical protein PAGU2196_11400 [Pseudomonas sp. PAGU 2196]